MAKKPNQKLKLIYLAKIMLENTDEENALTLSQIQTALSLWGISRKKDGIQ